MIKSKTVLEVKRNDRIYQLECEPDSPLGEVYDALCAMRSFVVQRINEQQQAEEIDSSEKQTE